MAKQKLTIRQYIAAIAKVGVTSFRIAPSAGIVRLADSLVQAALPIATTYYAALTTTALTAAYGGDEPAGNQALVYVGITAALGLVLLAWNSVSSYVSQKTSYQIRAIIDDRMIEHFGSLPFALYDDKEVVDLHEKAKRFSYFFSYIFDTIGQMATAIISAIGALVALVYVSPWLAAIVGAVTLPNIIIQLRLARRQAQHWEGNITNRRRMGNLGWMLQESQNIAEMRIYGVVRHLVQLRAAMRDKDEKERLQFELKTIWKQLLASVGEALVELGALVWVTLQIIDRAQPVGQFVYVQQMVSRALGQAGSLASQLGRIDEDLANIVDYQKFMEIAEAPKRQPKLTKLPERIALEQVSFAYPKTERVVLDNVTFTVKRGQHVAIVGENGAGKSTLIKLIMGLYEPTSGRILLDETPLDSINPESWHQRIALLGQEFIKYWFATIRENVMLGDVSQPENDERMAVAMQKAEFQSVVDKLEHGVDTYIERWMAQDNDEATATELSGGQYQRLALARNFYRDAPIIILDEPTSAIDALAEARIFKHLFAAKDKTIITVSHRLSTIKKADMVYMMAEGRVVEQGTAKELLEQRGAFYTMFESQL